MYMIVTALDEAYHREKKGKRRKSALFSWETHSYNRLHEMSL